MENFYFIFFLVIGLLLIFILIICYFALSEVNKKNSFTDSFCSANETNVRIKKRKGRSVTLILVKLEKCLPHTNCVYIYTYTFILSYKEQFYEVCLEQQNYLVLFTSVIERHQMFDCLLFVLFFFLLPSDQKSISNKIKLYLYSQIEFIFKDNPYKCQNVNT